MLISITPRSAALPSSSWAETGWMGVLAKARAAAPASDRGRRRERCTGIERLKGHSLSGRFLVATVRPHQLQQK